MPAPPTVHAAHRLPWPLPAVLAWTAAWGVFAAARGAGLETVPAFSAAALLGAAIAGVAGSTWRRALAAGGFPLSASALGALPGLPAWAWLVAAAPLLLAYPLRAWRDAPFFPTPAAALQGLEGVVGRLDGARVLDAGCGLGHGLAALRRLWPGAQLSGIEWSRPLAWIAGRRCRWARVERGDMWAASWAGCSVVYLFQRPESMARAWTKARAEMAAGSWLVSLEFEVPGVAATARAGVPGGKPVWAYRVAGGAPSSTAPAPRR